MVVLFIAAILAHKPSIVVIMVANWLATRWAYSYGAGYELESLAIADLTSVILLALIRTKQAGSIASLFVLMMGSYWLASIGVVHKAAMYSITEFLGYGQILIMVFYGMVDGRRVHISAV